MSQRKLRSLLTLLGAAALLPWLALPAGAADGDFDTTFGGGDGIVHDKMTGASSFGYGVLHVAPDGGFTMGGGVAFSSDPFNFDFASCLFGRDGAIQDCSSFAFDYGGGNGSDIAAGVSYQLDGRRVFAGYADGSNAEPESRIALLGLQATNNPDTGFSGNGKTNLDFAGVAGAAAVATRRNGDVLVAGYYDHEVSSTGSGFDCMVARLLDDGTPDSSFSGNGQKTISWDLGGDNDDTCTGLALYGDGRVLVSAYAEKTANSRDFAVARLTSDGDLDDTFSSDGKRTIAFDQGGGDDDLAWAIALDRRNRIVVAGQVQTAGGYRLGIVRLLDDGSLDDSFAGSGKLSINFDATSDDILDVSQLLILPPPSNDIVISGIRGTLAGGFIGYVVALHEDGSFDDSFSGNGKKTIIIPSTDSLLGAHMANQGGKLLLAGGWSRLAAQAGDFWVVRLYRDAIFGDDFEGGKLRLWSDHADP